MAKTKNSGKVSVSGRPSAKDRDAIITLSQLLGIDSGAPVRAEAVVGAVQGLRQANMEVYMQLQAALRQRQELAEDVAKQLQQMQASFELERTSLAAEIAVLKAQVLAALEARNKAERCGLAADVRLAITTAQRGLLLKKQAA